MVEFLWKALKEGLSLWIGWIAALSTVSTLISFFLDKMSSKINIPKSAYRVGLIVVILSACSKIISDSMMEILYSSILVKRHVYSC